MADQVKPDVTQHERAAVNDAGRTVRDAGVNTSPVTGNGHKTETGSLKVPAEQNPNPPAKDPTAPEESTKAQDKAENNYESLDRNRSNTPQHLYRPINTSAALKGKSNVDVHTCPLPIDVNKSPRGLCVVQMFSGGGKPYSSRRPARSAGITGDEIIELHNDLSRKREDGEERGERGGRGKSKTKVEAEVTTKPTPLNQNVPNTHFAIACMVALCFNLPLGILAMYFSLRAVTAFQEGHNKLGQKRSRWSIVLSLLGITLTTVIVSSVVFYIATQGHKSISRSRAFRTKGGINL